MSLPKELTKQITNSKKAALSVLGIGIYPARSDIDLFHKSVIYTFGT